MYSLYSLYFVENILCSKYTTVPEIPLKWNDQTSEALKYWGHFLRKLSSNGSRPTRLWALLCWNSGMKLIYRGGHVKYHASKFQTHLDLETNSDVQISVLRGWLSRMNLFLSPALIRPLPQFQKNLLSHPLTEEIWTSEPLLWRLK